MTTRPNTSNAQATTALTVDPNTNDRSQAPSIISLRIPQTVASIPNTAATSMVTVCPDEKEGAIGEIGVGFEEGEGMTCSREPTSPEPQVHLTFLLVSGSRKTMSFGPETTIGRVKELVWNAWPSGACRRPCRTYSSTDSQLQIGQTRSPQRRVIFEFSTSGKSCRMKILFQVSSTFGLEGAPPCRERSRVARQ